MQNNAMKLRDEILRISGVNVKKVYEVRKVLCLLPVL